MKFFDNLLGDTPERIESWMKVMVATTAACAVAALVYIVKCFRR